MLLASRRTELQAEMQESLEEKKDMAAALQSLWEQDLCG